MSQLSLSTAIHQSDGSVTLMSLQSRCIGPGAVTLPELSLRDILTGVADVAIGLVELKDSVLDGFGGIQAWGAIFDRSPTPAPPPPSSSQRQPPQQCAPGKATSRESLPHFGAWQAQEGAKRVSDSEHPKTRSKSSRSGRLRDSTNMWRPLSLLLVT